MVINRSAMLAKKLRRYQQITIDGDEYRIQSLSDAERNDVELSAYDAKGKRDFAKIKQMKARWIIACLVDEDDNTMFSEADVPAICEMDSRITDTLQDAILEHVGFSEADRIALVKKSNGTESEG